jgi:phage replication-related protein YjqB (UPF0714/DUF867 family)
MFVNTRTKERSAMSSPVFVDVYPDLDALKRELRAGRDYRISVLDRKCAVTIFSPHGGFVDEGTSGLARAIAGSNYNLFDFQGLHAANPWTLHVTSTRFRDPQLMKLLETSIVAVSVHGMDDHQPGQTTIWLGGLNKPLKQIMQAKMEAEGFSVDPSPPRFRGEHRDNVVNLARGQGVQLELPLTLRKQMYQGGVTFRRHGRCPRTTDQFTRFVRAIRSALAAWQSQISASLAVEARR